MPKPRAAAESRASRDADARPDTQAPGYGWEEYCCAKCAHDPDWLRLQREMWRADLGVKLGYEVETLRPWREGDGIVHAVGLPNGTTWRRGTWTGGRWEAEARTE